jgi:hypothetical protein
VEEEQLSLLSSNELKQKLVQIFLNPATASTATTKSFEEWQCKQVL